MTVVVDLGCRTYGEDESIGPLVRRFKPTNLYGFDPLLPDDEDYWIADTYVRIERIAAWTRPGRISLGVGAPTELDATPVQAKNGRGEWSRGISVECFDLPQWLGWRDPVVLKMNIEGGEFTLLQTILDRGVADKIERLVIAWHDSVMDTEDTRYADWRKRLEARLTCPVEPWTLDFGGEEA